MDDFLGPPRTWQPDEPPQLQPVPRTEKPCPTCGRYTCPDWQTCREETLGLFDDDPAMCRDGDDA